MTDETQVDVPTADAPAEPEADAPVAPPAADEPVAAVAPAMAPAAEPAPVATTASKPPTPRRKRVMGDVGQIVGILGIVLSLALAVGTVAGSVWLTGQVNDVGAMVDNRLAESQPKLDALTAKVAEIKSGVDQVIAAADTVAQAATPSDGVIAALRTKVDAVEARYAELRNAYGNLRENVSTATGSLQLLERVIPGFDLPQAPIDALGTLDARVQELDASVSGILTTAFDGSTVREAAAAISEKVEVLSSAIDTALDVITEAGAKLSQARADIAAGVARLVTIITVGGILIALLFVYMAFLHWVLFRTSRSASRGG